MIGAKFGNFLDGPLRPLVHKIKVRPNTLSLAGFAVNVVAAAVLTQHLGLGGVLIIAAGLFDMLDGMVARAHGTGSTFGAFLDSFLDRVSDALLFLAVAWYMGANVGHSGAFLSLAAMVGAFLVSYVRARAEGLGIECREGLMERGERIVVLAAGGIFGFMGYALWIIFVLTWFTLAQRVYYVWKTIGK